MPKDVLTDNSIHARFLLKATSVNKASFPLYPWLEKASGKCTNSIKVVLFVCYEERISLARAFLHGILLA